MSGFPDKRTGSKCHYSIEDAALGAFSVFFVQSPSSLSFQKTWTGKTHHFYTYRFVNRAPLRDGHDALKVNGCEVTITSAAGRRLYKNAFATDFKISTDYVKQIVADGRARWKIENEKKKILNAKGYHLTHNFGHGKSIYQVFYGG